MRQLQSVRRTTAFILLVLGVLAVLTPLAIAGELESRVKAAYVYNFTKFIDWPSEGSAGKGETVRICIVGNDSLRTLLGELHNREVKGKSLAMARVKDLNALEACDMVYISRSEERQFPLILQRLQGTHVLTVSDIPQFARKGGMIGFVTENERVKIEVNQQNIRQAGLKVSAKLLEVARVIP